MPKRTTRSSDVAASPQPKRHQTSAPIKNGTLNGVKSSPAPQHNKSENAEKTESKNGQPKKLILLNAFDMSNVGHLSPGQWNVCDLLSFDGFI